MTVAQPSQFIQKRRVTMVGAGANLALTLSKIALGFWARSEALIADGIHSLANMLIDLQTLVAAKLGARRTDQDHPYAHGRFETFTAVVIGLFLLMVAGAIIWEAVQRLNKPETLLFRGFPVLCVALLSIGANELLFRYTLSVAHRARSKLLEANAWRHRSEAISSVVVGIGAAGTLSGFAYFDALAALMVGVMVAAIGLRLLRESADELVETALPGERLQTGSRTIVSTDGVRALNALRTHSTDPDPLVDVHLTVDRAIHVSEKHRIDDMVRENLIRDLEEVSDVLVHVDPEDDEKGHVTHDLALRHELIAKIRRHWQGLNLSQPIRRINLHYFHGKVAVEVVLPLAVIDGNHTLDKIENRLRAAQEGFDFVSRIRVFYEA